MDTDNTCYGTYGLICDVQSSHSARVSTATSPCGESMASPEHVSMQAAARVVAAEPLTSTQGMPAKTAAWHGQQLPWQQLPWQPLLSMTSACCCASMEKELKEQKSRQLRKLLTRRSPDLDGQTQTYRVCLTMKGPMYGTDECASGVFLRTRRPSVVHRSRPCTGPSFPFVVSNYFPFPLALCRVDDRYRRQSVSACDRDTP